MENKTAIWIVIGCVAVCLIGGIVLLITGGALVRWVYQEPENINVEINTPIQVSKGEEFMIEVRVENTGNDPQELDSIDIDSSYLEGIYISSTEPDYTDYSLYDLFESYYFERNIPANSSLSVKFYVEAVKTGDFAGEIDVCINSPSNCTGFPTRTIVE
jgi:hypothetical protein